MKNLIKYCKIIFGIIPILLFTGCSQLDDMLSFLKTKFVMHPTINEYVNVRYKETLKKSQYTSVECGYIKDEKGVRVIKPNLVSGYRISSFPSDFVIVLNGDGYEVYFEEQYLNTKKEVLMGEIDECMRRIPEVVYAEKSWGEGVIKK